MQHKYFKTICASKNYRYLILDGSYLAERTLLGFPVLLFQVENHYVELVFRRNGLEILTARQFSDVDELDPYLTKISLPSFLQY